MSATDRLNDVRIATADQAVSPEQEQERRVAIFDLLEENSFRITPREGKDAPAGPYALDLAIEDRRLRFRITTEGGQEAGELILSLGPFRRIIRDYFAICESYYEGVKTLTADKIEAIDMARRGLHNEGAAILMERLEGKIEVDKDTARRLFTLITALHG